MRDPINPVAESERKGTRFRAVSCAPSSRGSRTITLGASKDVLET